MIVKREVDCGLPVQLLFLLYIVGKEKGGMPETGKIRNFAKKMDIRVRMSSKRRIIY